MRRYLPAVGVLLTLFCAEAGAQRTPTPPASLLQPSVYGPDVFTFYCAPCHGVDGKGHGPVAVALTTPPSDLTTLARRHGGVFPRQEVEAFVTNGRPVPAHGTSAMPVWGPTFRALEPSDRMVKVRIENVVTFLASLQTP